MMGTPHEDYVAFVQRAQRAIASRQPGAPIVFTVPQITDDKNGFVNLITYDLQPAYLPMMIIHLVDALVRSAPDVKEVRELKQHCDRLLGTVEAADVTAGKH